MRGKKGNGNSKLKLKELHVKRVVAGEWNSIKERFYYLFILKWES